MTCPREVLDRYLATVGGGHWEQLADLYAPDAVVEHPYAGSVLHGWTALHRHFDHLRGLGLRMHATDLVVHDTSDSEIIVAEFAYRGTGHGQAVHRRNVFVMTIRDGLIHASRDYSADVRG